MYPSRATRPVWRDAKVVLLTLILMATGAVVFASAGASGPVRQAVQLDCGEGGQSDVTGTWRTVQSNNYTITWTFKQQGTSLTGKAALPPNEAARARYTGTVGQVKGSIVGDKLDVVVTWPPKTDGVLVRGRYVGTVEKGATGGGKVNDGRAWDLANPSAKGRWTGAGAAACRGSVVGRLYLRVLAEGGVPFRLSLPTKHTYVATPTRSSYVQVAAWLAPGGNLPKGTYYQTHIVFEVLENGKWQFIRTGGTNPSSSPVYYCPHDHNKPEGYDWTWRATLREGPNKILATSNTVRTICVYQS